jgi:CheY-like chemotaxis protein
MNNPDRDQLRSYYRCPACGKILFDGAWNLSDPAVPAPCCGATGTPRPVWPDPAALKLIGIALEQDLSHPAWLSIAAVSLGAAVEHLLEGAVLELLKRQGLVPEMAEAMLEKHPGADGLLHLYDELSERPLEALLTAEGPGGFVKKFTRLGPLRRKLEMDDRSPAAAEERAAVEYVRDNCLKAFFTVYNEIRSRKDAPPAGALSVLIIDDEVTVLDFLGKMVERKGARALKAASGAEGLALFAQHRPALTLLDVSLPDGDGLSILQAIKKIDGDARVNLATGMGGEAFRKEVERLGAAGYLPKPVDLDALTALLGSLNK